MSPICYCLIVLTVVFAAMCIWLRSKNKSFEGMLCKFMASFGFISLSIVGFCTNPKDTYYFCMICFALFFGFFGDVLLGIKEIAPTFRGKLVPLGLLYFLIGHVFYVCGFVAVGGFNAWTLLAFPAGACFALLMIKILKIKVKPKLAAALVAYYSMLVFKVATAAVMLIGSQTAVNALIFASCVCFLVSDSILGILYFTPVKRKNLLVTLELSLYYPAQILAALTLALVK
ncbi:MAG: hypothetical protein J6A60_05115 [Clostridia bacterium]|nr:hypothetical protein [Clostridia bacterium]